MAKPTSGPSSIPHIGQKFRRDLQNFSGSQFNLRPLFLHTHKTRQHRLRKPAICGRLPCSISSIATGLASWSSNRVCGPGRRSLAWCGKRCSRLAPFILMSGAPSIMVCDLSSPSSPAKSAKLWTLWNWLGALDDFITQFYPLCTLSETNTCITI